MTFSIAEPLQKNKYDDTKVFDFSLGQTF